MDGYSGRRTAGGLLVSRKCSSIVLRDSADSKDQNPRICSRIGCSSKLNSMKGPQIELLEKAKTSRLPFRPCGAGKEIVGCSSKASHNSGAKKPCTDSKKKAYSHSEMTDTETDSSLDESETSEPIEKSQIEHQLRPMPEASSPSGISQSRHGKKNTQATVLGSRVSTSFGPSISRHSSRGAKSSSSINRYNLKSFRCDTISDVVQSSSSSSDSSLGRKKDTTKKKTIEAESSLSARGKRTSGSSFIDDRRNANSNRGISISESRSSVLAPPTGNDSISVRTRRSAARARLSEHGDVNRFTESSPSFTTRFPMPGLVFDANEQNLDTPSSTQALSRRANSSSRLGSGADNVGSDRSTVSFEVGMARSLMRDGMRQYNLEGIAEVLLALDRIEQDEEFSHEHLLALETNLLLSGLGFHDQHREMRLDIDNMSYEELLALEERMGTVSTALTDEELDKCLKKSTYQMTCPDLRTIGCKGNGDDVKCSICQEEYIAGEEMGRLGCDHRYHVGCVQKWLRLKNWCPICKAPAAGSSSSRTSPTAV
ncbi:putative E3 ubiquitin-protein ligase HIP1 [Drosera capensis]